MLGARTPRARRRDESGAVAILFGILALLLFVMAGLVVNLGQARDVRRQSQNAADASALAAAGKLYPANGTCVLDAPACTALLQGRRQRQPRRTPGSTSAPRPSDWSSCTDAARYYAVPSQTPCVSFTDASQTLAQATAPVKPIKVRVAMPIRQISGGRHRPRDRRPHELSARRQPGRGQPSTQVSETCGLCLVGDVSPGNADYSVTGGIDAVNGSVNLQGRQNHHERDRRCTHRARGTGSGGTFSTERRRQGTPRSPTRGLREVTCPAVHHWPHRQEPTCARATASGGQGIYGSFALRQRAPAHCKTGPVRSSQATGRTSNNTGGRGTDVTLCIFTCKTGSAPRVVVCLDGRSAGRSRSAWAERRHQLHSADHGSAPRLWRSSYDRYNNSGHRTARAMAARARSLAALYALRSTLGFRGNCVLHLSVVALLSLSDWQRAMALRG